MHRVQLTQPKGKSSLLIEEMDRSVRYFHKNYSQYINIEEFAASQNMSVSWFIRNFKEYTGSTPAQYILSLRISNAQTLLENTDYNVTEISEIIGYENPLYFCRLFKKHTGGSPTEYRRISKVL